LIYSLKHYATQFLATKTHVDFMTAREHFECHFGACNRHDGQYCEWEAGSPVGFAPGDTVGLLLQITADGDKSKSNDTHAHASSSGSDDESVSSTAAAALPVGAGGMARMTIYRNGRRRGVPFDGLAVGAGNAFLEPF
jgi:hypothetical protein